MSTTSEAPESISILFARDPKELTNQNLDQIIAHLREGRARFVAGDIKAGSAKAAGVAKAPAKPKPEKGLDVQIDLEDLL